MNAPIRIKTFQSKTVQEAYELIRREFGPNASILETRTAKRGWLTGNRVEVIASSVDCAQRQSVQEERAPGEGAETEPDIDTSPETDSIPGSNDSSPCNSNNSESVRSTDAIDALQRDALPTEERSHEHLRAKLNRICTQVLNELYEAGIERSIAEQWIEAAKAANIPGVMDSAWTLSAEIHSWVQGFVHVGGPIELDRRGQQVIAIVGPTGVGKTTAIAKIASFLQSNLNGRVGVLQTDPRPTDCGGMLNQYSEVAGFKLDSLSVGCEHRVREQFGCCDIILVDTCGYSPKETESLAELNLMLSAIPVSTTYLVLPATCNANAFVRYYEAYSPLRPDGLILTKIDEAGGLGPLFACLQACSIPVSYLACGRQVPSEMSLASRQRLAQLILQFD